MKRIVSAVIAASALCAPCAYAMNGAALDINVTVNGGKITFDDQQPVIINGRTLLPVRGVMEALGKEVSWDPAASRAVISDGNISVSLGIGDDIMLKTENGVSEEIKLDSVPLNINDRTCLPIRAVAESFGASVEWDAAAAAVIING